MEPVDPQQPYGLLFGEIENTSIALGLDGLAGSEVVPQADRLILYWHGPLPEVIESIIDASELTVDVRPVPYSPAALHDAARSTFSRPGVNGAGVGRDFASLHVTVRPGTSAEDKAAAGLPVAVPGFAESLPVTVSERGDAVALGLTR